MRKISLTLSLLLLVTLTSGCVRRIVTIDSQPQGAEVFFDHKLVGKTPCEHEFLYYGGHHLELIKPGYSNHNSTLELKPPIYEYFPLSLLFEVFVPWQLTNEHSVNLKLEKGRSNRPVLSPVEQPQEPLASPKLERIQTR